MKRPINFDRPRGVVTHGKGNRCLKHLNLKRSLADIDRERDETDIAIHAEIERRAAGLPFPTYDELLSTLQLTEPAA